MQFSRNNLKACELGGAKFWPQRIRLSSFQSGSHFCAD
jgi:hypothetical protein